MPTPSPTIEPTMEPTTYPTSLESPNFVFIFADDLGFNDVKWRGPTNIYTPNLDDLRNNEALELTRFYVTPKCSPTRTSFMIGRYSYHLGMQNQVGMTETMACGIEPSIKTTFFTKLKCVRDMIITILVNGIWYVIFV